MRITAAVLLAIATLIFSFASLSQAQEGTTDLESALALAEEGARRNNDWIPFVYEFSHTPMVLAPSGSFIMGRPGAARGTQALDHYWIDQFEVTQSDYATCVTLGFCVPVNIPFIASQSAQQPVTGLTWRQANDYCVFRGGRLPTEPEWEYAGRGPDGLIYPWGNVFDQDPQTNNRDYLLYRLNGTVTLHPTTQREVVLLATVGERLLGASWIGAVDMAGNASEWTSSLRMEDPYDASHEDNTDLTSGRMYRGGMSDRTNGDQVPLYAAYSDIENADTAYSFLGMRCVLDATNFSGVVNSDGEVELRNNPHNTLTEFGDSLMPRVIVQVIAVSPDTNWYYVVDNETGGWIPSASIQPVR